MGEPEVIEIPPPDVVRGQLVKASRRVSFLRGLLKLSRQAHPSEDSQPHSHEGAETDPQRREEACV
jgi:hypothetical protein